MGVSGPVINLGALSLSLSTATLLYLQLHRQKHASMSGEAERKPQVVAAREVHQHQQDTHAGYSRAPC